MTVRAKKNGDRPGGAITVRENPGAELSGGLFDRARSPGAAETACEFLDAAGGIDEFLLAGKEGMACGADADLEVTPGGAHVINGAASAGDGGLFVFWVNLCFHGSKRDVEATRFDAMCNGK